MKLYIVHGIDIGYACEGESPESEILGVFFDYQIAKQFAEKNQKKLNEVYITPVHVSAKFEIEKKETIVYG